MADSEEKKSEEAPEKPLGPSSITHKTAKGHTTRNIDPVTHKFTTQPTRKASTEEIAKVSREFLNAKLMMGPDGKPTKASLTRYMQMFEVIYEHVVNSRGTNDAKMVMAAQSAFKTLAGRTYGPERDVDIEAFQSGVKFVVITQPDLPNQGEIKPREEKQPLFLKGEFVTNEPTGQEGQNSDAPKSTQN